MKDGAWQGQQHRCRKRVEKNNIFLDRKKKGDATLSDEARKKTAQLELYSFANCLSAHDTESYPPELDNSRQLRVLTKRLKRSERDGCQVERQERKATYRTKQLK